ncbi:MAG: TIGR00730 family Rossman fold protein [Clostridium sp.]|nr:TIGR00730 family Rossman fold protein [Bacteroides sp.]MCM1198735.1 TIGR00730 family Rossman fold protein [Clostridium sp.]
MKIAVYLGSKPGNDEKYMRNAFLLGKLLAEAGAEIIYGGAKVGTMGALARGAAEAGGKITGVFPKGFRGKKEFAEAGLEVVETGDGYAGYRLIETENFDDRIRTMETLADACIILPGSCGTMHEFFSWHEGRAIGRHHKKTAILNTYGYYDPLIAMFRNMVTGGFTSQDDLDSLIVASTPEELVAILVAD